jgi:predicted TPR repeat methyltransferase
MHSRPWIKGVHLRDIVKQATVNPTEWVIDHGTVDGKKMLSYEWLQRATELAPRYDRGWLWLGRVLQRAGRPGEALRQFERALQCNPDSRDAQSELKLSSSR